MESRRQLDDRLDKTPELLRAGMIRAIVRNDKATYTVIEHLFSILGGCLIKMPSSTNALVRSGCPSGPGVRPTVVSTT